MRMLEIVQNGQTLDGNVPVFHAVMLSTFIPMTTFSFASVKNRCPLRFIKPSCLSSLKLRRLQFLRCYV